MNENRLDLASEPPAAARHPATGSPSGEAKTARKFVGVTFACCGAYSRVYINRQNEAYEGRCPRCGKPIRLEIGPGGTDSRFFTAR